MAATTCLSVWQGLHTLAASTVCLRTRLWWSLCWLEELEVQKRLVETGKVCITKVVHERETLVDEPLFQDTVAITRVPIQRVVDGPVPVREENGTTIISLVEEVLVVEKRLMLREEIHIRQQRIETHQPQRVTLRSEEVQVERVPRVDT
jgi:uncharacterized protein (TIGR02271 family)